MKNIIFNSSMPRACSTLMQNILSQNPEIYATGTDGSLELLFGARRNYTDSAEFKANDHEQMQRAWRGFCKQGLQGYCEGLSEKPTVCIKSRGIGIHHNWYSTFMEEDVKVICMVRNLKSIYSSMEKIFRKSQENHQFIQNHAEMQGTSTAKRVDIWSNGPPIGLALERFEQMILEGIDKKVLFVRMEDLQKEPAREMTRVYEYLGLPQYTHDFDNVEQATQEDDAVYGMAPDLHTIRPKVEYTQPDYYDVLGKNICDWIDDRFKWYQQYFNYR